jgi:hypothetical protein
MSKKVSPEKLFDDISQFVSESRVLLDQGAMMELAGLDQRVNALCEAVLLLSQEERITYANRLQELFGELKTLGEEMVRQRDSMSEMVRQLSDHKKASVAYRTTDHSAHKKTEE